MKSFLPLMMTVIVLALNPSLSAAKPAIIALEVVPADALEDDSIEGALAIAPELWESTRSPVNRGYSDLPYWYKVALEGKAGDYILEVAYPALDALDFYRVELGKVAQSIKAGDGVAFHSRDIPTRTFAFDVDGVGEGTVVYLRAETEGSHQLPLHVWNRDEFYHHAEGDSAKRALFYGMLLVTFATNLLMYAATRSKTLLLFALMQFGVLMVISTVQGVAFQYIFPTAPSIHERLSLLAMPFTALMASAFCREFLSLSSKWAAGNIAVQILQLVSIVSLVLAVFLSYSWSVRVSITTGLFVSVFLLSIGCIAAAKRIARAGIFSLGWALFLAGVVMYIMNLAGYFPTLVLFDNSIETGAVITSLLMSFAIGRNLHQEKEARLEEKTKKIAALEEMRESKEDFHVKARMHPLTGLPNRDVLDQYLRDFASSASRQDTKLGLLFIDFSNLSEINKTMGHEQADKILTVFVNQLDLLLNQCRLGQKIDKMNPSRTLCHVESATFAVILMGENATVIEADAKTIVDHSRLPICFRKLTLDPNSICGLSIYPDYSSSVDALMRHAFIAFDEAEKAIERFSVYDNKNDEYSEERLTLMGDLREAIQNNDLELFYQPQMDLSQGSIYGFEALLRWNHAKRGFVPPDEFIPIAETAGLISTLTQWVVNQACFFILQMRDCGGSAKVAVNISALNLREKDFAAKIIHLLRTHKIAPERLCLEVTETAAMADPERSMMALKELSEAGIHLSVDDYGTGQSSLQYLKRLPVNEIKIDRSFVMMMHQSAHDETIVRTTIMMCHLLGYKIVAEGVENDEIENILKTIDCDYAQGYYYSKPVPSAAALELLQREAIPT